MEKYKSTKTTDAAELEQITYDGITILRTQTVF